MFGAAFNGCVLEFQRKPLDATRRMLVRLAAPNLMKLRASGYRVRGCCARRGPSGASDIVNPSPNIGDLASVIIAYSEQKFNTYFRPLAQFYRTRQMWDVSCLDQPYDYLFGSGLSALGFGSFIAAS
jgi:hypothetical protein